MYGLCRYLDWVTLTYISRSIDFYTFYVTLPYVLNCKAFNHQTLYSTSSQCTDSAGTLTWYLDYIVHSSDFDTFYVDVRYLLKYKTYNH